MYQRQRPQINLVICCSWRLFGPSLSYRITVLIWVRAFLHARPGNMLFWGVLIWKTKSDDQPCMYIPRNLPYDVLNCSVNNRRRIEDNFHLKRWGVLVAQPRRIVRWRGAVNAITVGRKTPSFPGFWFRVKGLRKTGASVSAKYGYLLIHRTSISSRISSQSASCNACDLPSFQTFVNAHTRFFTLLRVLWGYYRRRSEWVPHADLWKFELRQVAEKFWEWHMVRAQDPLRSIVGAKELPGLCSRLFSLHLLATPGPKPCAPLVNPFSLVPFLGRGWRRASRRAVSLPLSCQDRKEYLPIAIRKMSLRPYARGRLGLMKVENGEAFPEPILGGL